MSVKVNQMSTTANNKDIDDDIAKMRENKVSYTLLSMQSR